jgi:hypothetical protein
MNECEIFVIIENIHKLEEGTMTQVSVLPFPYYCRSLVLAVPIDTSSETSSAQAGDVERASVLWVCWS